MAKKAQRKRKKHVSARRIVAEIRRTTRAVETLQGKSPAAEARRLGKKIRKLNKLEGNARGLCRSLAI